MSQVFQVHFLKGVGIPVSALKGVGVWAEMVEFMRERDPGLERVAAYNWNLQQQDWDTSRWGAATSEPAMVVFRDKDDCDAFALEFSDHIKSVQTRDGEDQAEDKALS